MKRLRDSEYSPITQVCLKLESLVNEFAKDNGSGYTLNRFRQLIDNLNSDRYNCDIYIDAIDKLASDLNRSGYESYAEDIWDTISDFNDNLREKKMFRDRELKEGNRVGNNEFVPDYIDQFLEDVAQFSNLYDYGDIIAFERDVFAPNDKNVKALKKLYRQFKEAAEYDDEEDIDRICQDIADLVIGVVDYEA